MKSRAVSGIVLTLLFFGMLPLGVDVQPTKAEPGTIYIRADGRVDPPTANITTVDNVTYTFTDNNYDLIRVERGKVIVDGNGYTLQGSGSGSGFSWIGIDNVTIKNTTIKNFYESIFVYLSSFNTISGNKIANMFQHVMALENSNNNIIFGNNITDNRREGIQLTSSNGNTISGNNIANMITFEYSLIFNFCSNNTIFGNNITYNQMGLVAVSFVESSGNRFYHNNFIDNDITVYNDGSVNVWDDDYPYGGNYWSDYTGIDVKSGPNQDQPGSDGIGDTPYIIDENNQDKYPLMEPWPCATGPPPIPAVGGVYIPTNKLDLLTPYIGLTILLAVAASTVVYVRRRRRELNWSTRQS